MSAMALSPPDGEGLRPQQEALDANLAVGEQLPQFAVRQKTDRLAGLASPAIDRQPAMHARSEPCVRQPVQEQRQMVRLDGKPAIRRLTIDMPANSHHFAGKSPLIGQAAYVLNRRIGECEVEGAISEGCGACVPLHVWKRANRGLRKDVEQGHVLREARVRPSAGHSADVKHAPAIAEILLDPALAAATQPATDGTVEKRVNRHWVSLAITGFACR